MSTVYVLTGGPGAGKTTLLEALEKEGYHVVPETARYLMEKHGIEYPKLTAAGRLEFQRMVAKKQIEMESNMGKHTHVFLDRGLPDNIAYCRIGRVDIPEEIIAGSRSGRYDKVFILDMLPEYRTDSIRAEDTETARNIHELIIEAYKSLGHDITFVPPFSVKERVEFIKSHIRI